MIQYNPKAWLALIFHTYSRESLKVLIPFLLFIGLYTWAITYIYQDFLHLHYNSTTVVHSILGIVLGLVLVFRLNSAYDRWWEGRILWGNLLNSCRNMAIKMDSLLEESDHKSREFFIRMIPNFAYSLKEHLRQGVIWDELDFNNEGVPDEIRNANNVPSSIASAMYRYMSRLLKTGQLSPEHLFVLDKEFKDFTNIQGGCERIRNTPIPYSYSMYMKKFIFTFIITLPFAFLTEFGYLTIPIVLIIFFILVTIELIAEEIENPFGHDANDLPTDTLCLKIRNNVDEIIRLQVKEAIPVDR